MMNTVQKKLTGLITEYDTTLHYFLSHTSYEYSKWNMSNYAQQQFFHSMTWECKMHTLGKLDPPPPILSLFSPCALIVTYYGMISDLQEFYEVSKRRSSWETR